MRVLVLMALLAGAATGGAAASELLFYDTFGRYEGIAGAAETWDLSDGWELRAGALAVGAAESALAVLAGCPEVAAGAITATVRPLARNRPGTWAAAGLMLYQGDSHYWRLALVEAPSGERYCELVESHGGVWQAQRTGRTALAAGQGVSGPWAFGRDYELRISLGRDSIAGEVREGEKMVFAVSYRFSPQAPAVRSGRPALETTAMEALFSGITVVGESAQVSAVRSRPPAAAIVPPIGRGLADEPGSGIARLSADALREVGMEVQLLDPAALADPQSFSRERFDVLVLVDCRSVPGPGLENLLAFLRAGGHLIAFGGPPFRELLWPWRGEWRSTAEVMERVRAEVSIVDFTGADLRQWTRATGNPGSAAETTLARGPRGTTALEVHIGDLAGWDTLTSPPLRSPFPAGQSVTCLWAKGGPRTTHLVVEWDERDGSRWMASVELTRDWRHYALRPEDFVYWPDSPAQGRGGPGDAFDPQQASRLALGLAQSHSAIPPGEHAYWVADIGAAPSPLPAAPELPALEAMSPWYKTYEIQLDPASHRVSADPDQRFFAAFQPLPASGRLISPVWRQRGLGTGSGQQGRWVPLLRVVTQSGEYRGAAASTYFATSGRYRGASWTYFGLDPTEIERQWEAFGPVLGGLAERLARGALLANGGTEQFSYFTEAAGTATPTLMARVVNLSTRLAELEVRLAVSDDDGRVVFEKATALQVQPGRIKRIAEAGPPLAPGRYRASCELALAPGATPVDRIAHEFSVIGPNPSPQFVTVRDGDFRLGGRTWYPHGVNYWPLYVAGLDQSDYWAHWLSPAQYDPEPVERDLAALESLGANMVSIQYSKADQAPALNDFLQRAKRHGILANVYVPGLHPLHRDEAVAEQLIRAARLAESDAIFAYDMAWEPQLGVEGDRRQWDSEWEVWIGERYGSIETAEKDWEFALPRLDGRPTGPTDDQLRQPGPHQRMVAAYRRFADDLIGQGYGASARFLRRLDPNHLLGARTGYGGTGQPSVVSAMAYDLVSGAAHLDFASPEGWGLSGDWESFERAGLTTAYGRWAGNGKPVFWSEFGYTIYPGTTPQKYEAQAEVYRNLYRMALQSGASGSAGWWLPGGYRVDENSDYGILNPDGTPRPAALELGRSARELTAPRARPAPSTWITIDRDLDVSGYAGTWERHAAEYVAAVRAGNTVGVRTEADGMSSADAPLVAVGGTPCNGSNPPKHLNAEFGEVTILDAAEAAAAVVGRDGAVVRVPADRPVRVRVQVVNTGVAAWLAPHSVEAKPGGVFVAAGERGGLQCRAPIPRDVLRDGAVELEFTLTEGISRPTEVTLAMLAEGRAWFGDRLRFTLTPTDASGPR